MVKKLTLVGNFKEETENGIAWEFIGIFDDVEKAKNSCVGDNYFYTSTIELNKADTGLDVTKIFDDVVYPNR